MSKFKNGGLFDMKINKKRITAVLMTFAMLSSSIPVAYAGQQNSYHDPAENWLESANRTEELDVNSTVTKETLHCYSCGATKLFTVMRTPEYTRDGQTALSRNIKYSDGTMIGGETKGSILDGIPNKDATYSGYHWTKSVCDTCATINGNMPTNDYGFNKNVYWLYDCAEDFMQGLEQTVSYAYADDTYHTKTTKGGSYCGFCYGTHYDNNSELERHTLESQVTPQPANGRFADGEHCTLCDYDKSQYVAAKSVIADYYGTVDGKPHTVTVTDLSETGVTTQIRYGNSANSCTLTSAPNYTEEGKYTVYYEITYTYKDVSMTENGVAYVWLRDESECGCTNPDCDCNDPNCDGNCCPDDTETGCKGDHKYILAENVPATCTTLGYDRYVCTECGRIEKRNYVESLGHAYQGVLVREATCETDGKLMEICSRCSDVKVTSTPKSEHKYKTYPVEATCTSSGYTVEECTVCGDRHITDITSTLSHNFESHTTPAGCETGGQTLHICHGCNSSFITDYTEPLGHKWDEGTLITDATCTGEGVMEYRCTRCDAHYLDGNTANGHVAGEPATCTEPQLCTNCGAVIQKALGHDYEKQVTEPTCTEMGYTTYTCTRCDDTYKGDYTGATGHKESDWIIDKQPTTDTDGSRHKECTECGEKLDEEVIEKLYNQGTTDSKGEATVGEYLVIVTDTDTKNPVANATVTLKNDNSFTVVLPDSRLLDFADQTTVTVLIKADKTPVPDRKIAVSDKNDNYSADITDKLGQITVPTGSGNTNGDGNSTVGNENDEGEEITLTVKVEDYETKRPIENCEIKIGNSGNILVKLPDGVDMDENNRITVTVTDNKKNPQEDMTIIVESDLGRKENGKTDKDGKLTVPPVYETEHHAAYVLGYPDGSFKPENSMTRAEAATIFARLLAEKLGESIPSTATTKFKDVPANSWYSGYVKYLINYGVVYGISDDMFAPDKAVTRAEFTAFAVRFFEIYGEGSEEIMNKYPEFSDISDGYWAAEYIKDAAIHGWIQGYEDGTFRADDPIRRSQVVTLTGRLLGHYADESYVDENIRKLNQFNDVSKSHWAYYEIMEAANSHTADMQDEESWI